MHIVERTKNIMMDAGSEWVMWLLVVLSIASVAVIFERIFALRSLKSDLSGLRRNLVDGLFEGGFSKARALLAGCRHPAALVALRGLARPESETTAKAAEEAMVAESVAQKRILERRFSFLATLGANAPFIGLFGTVVGILQAFDALGHSSVAGSSAIAPQAVMSSIAKALVATAIGLGVAIPAVIAFNMLERVVKSALEDAEIFSREILSYLASSNNRSEPISVREPTAQPKQESIMRRAASVS